MKQYALLELRNQFAKLNYQWLPFHLIGVRNKADNPDQFDDLFYLINGNNMKVYTGTTNPGSYYLQNFFNKAFGGTALLAPGQYIDTWSPGIIYNNPGWRQVKPIKIFRDSNKDLKSDEVGPTQTGMFSIHIHKMFNQTKALKIWNWSAGCQGFNDPVQWNDFMIETTGHKFLTYTLLDEF